MNMKKTMIRSFVILSVASIAIQLVPVSRTNPPVESDIPAPSDVKSILKTACYDCHSNETIWPWYSKVAPVSWLVALDTKSGRNHLNFSTWDRYTPERQTRLIQRAMTAVHKGKMPFWFYVMKHPEAKITPEKLQRLDEWAKHLGD